MTRRAFTLVEVLVATALMLALVGAMYGFLHDLVSVRARALDLTARHRAADAALETLETHLACAIVADARAGAGVVGDDRGITVRSRGVTARLTPPAGESPPPLADRQDFELRFETDRLTATLDGAVHDLGPVAGFRLRYFDGEAWADEYDSRRLDALPVAVEVRVWYDRTTDVDGEETTPDRTRLIVVPDAQEPSA